MHPQPSRILMLFVLLVAVTLALVSCARPNVKRLSRAQDVDGLIAALSYEDPTVRSAAAAALGRLGGPRAVEALLPALSDEDASVRQVAAQALPIIRPTNAASVSELAASTELGGAVSAISFSPDGRVIAFGDMAGSIHFWDARQATEIKVLEGFSGRISDLEFSPDGSFIAAMTPSWLGEDFRKLRLWDSGSYEELPALSLIGNDDSVDVRAATVLAMSPDGKLLALDTCVGPFDFGLSGSLICDSASFRLLDSHTGASVAEMPRPFSNGIWDIEFSPDGALAVVCGMDGTARLFDVESREERYIVIKSNMHVLDSAFSPDGRTLAVGLGDSTIHLFDVETGTDSAVLIGNTEAVTSVAFGPNGDLLVSGSTDKTVRLWDVAARTMLATLNGHADAVLTVAFSPDGMLVASGGNDMSVRFWGLPR